MNLLLDTYTFLWAIDDNPNLSPEARSAITDGSNMDRILEKADQLEVGNSHFRTKT